MGLKDNKELLKQGEDLFTSGDLSGAEVCFKKILDINPRHIQAVNNIGVIAFMRSDSGTAIDYFNKALGIDEGYLDSLENLALCLEKIENYTEAADKFKKIIDLGGNNPETFISLIKCLLHNGEFSQAREYLNRFVHTYGNIKDTIELKNKINDEIHNILHSGVHPVEKAVKFYLDEGDLIAARDLLVPSLREKAHDSNYQNLKTLLTKKEKLKRLPVSLISAADLLEKDPSRKLRWGDHWFCKELCQALSEEGAVINTKDPKVLIYLHGVPSNKINIPTYNIIWIHSHPDMITPESLSPFDHIFCLSPQFLQKIKNMGRDAELLIGGTAKHIPHVIQKFSHDIVFVANGKQGKGRKIIHDLLSLGNRWIGHLEVWGEGWEGILPEKCIQGLYFDNQKLPVLYASSRVVLNDHHEDMLREGFLNPRILDVMASGGVVVSDCLLNAKDLFGEALLTYKSLSELDQILNRLFEDDSYRDRIRNLGLEKVGIYSFKSTAQKIIEHIVTIDEDFLEKRAKNSYMEKVWAPVKGKLDTHRIKRLKEVTSEQCEGSTLDVGCANGDSTAIMKGHNPSLDLTGLELTDWGFTEAVRNHPDLKFVQGDAKKLPFPNQSFDTVVLDHIIEHFYDPVPLILEAKRVARKRVVIGIPIMHLNDPDHKIAWRLDDFRNLLLGFFPTFSIRGMREPDGIEVNDSDRWNFVVATGFLENGNRKEIPLTQPLHLHLGCGQRSLSGFLNIDIIPSPAVDLLCDSRRLPLPEGSVSRIETYHMIEHLPRHDFIEALFEWNRVLEEGGLLVIECPDFEATVREYLEGKKFRINNIFGLQRHPGDFHLFGYTYENLAEVLQGLGFSDIKKEAPTDYHASDEPSIRLTAIKVLPVQRPPDTRSFLIKHAQETYSKAIKADQKSKNM